MQDPGGREHRDGSGISRLLVLVSCVVFLEGLFFTALGPLLPGLKDHLALSTSEVGLLAAAYGLGILIAAVPAAMCSASLGVKATAIIGLLLFAVGNILFGFARTYPAFLTAQLVAGVAASAMWSASLVWLIGAAPTRQRGRIIGLAFGASAAGEMMGPIVGGLAATAGRGPSFVGAAFLAVVLACSAFFVAAPPRVEATSALSVGAVTVPGPIRTAAWLNSVPGVMVGALLVLATLQLHRLGSGPAQIAMTFVIAGIAGVIAQPLIGQWSDRRGRLLPMRFGLTASIPTMLALAWVPNRWVASLLLIVALTTMKAFWGPAVTLLSDACDRAGVGQASALAVSLLVATAGFALGSLGSGAIVQVLGQPWAYLVAAGLLLGALLALNDQSRCLEEERSASQVLSDAHAP